MELEQQEVLTQLKHLRQVHLLEDSVSPIRELVAHPEIYDEILCHVSSLSHGTSWNQRIKP